VLGIEEKWSSHTDGNHLHVSVLEISLETTVLDLTGLDIAGFGDIENGLLAVISWGSRSHGYYSWMGVSEE